MSVRALTWAFDEQVFPATRKLTLIALADCADSDGVCFPSLVHMLLKTSLNRTTLIECLDDLEARGLLIDTGKKVGKTMQVKVYKLNGLPSENTHYVYKLTDGATGNFYFGVRSCFGNPGNDEYNGSGSWPNQCRKDGVVLSKEVVAVFNSRSEAEAYEIEAIGRAACDEKCRNKFNSRKNRTVSNSPENHAEQSGFSRLTVRKTGPVTVREPSKEPPKAESANLPGYEIPLLLNTPKFLIAWDEWTTHRREKKKKLTPLSTKKQLSELEAMGEDRAVAAIEHSIKKGYTGIYEPKDTQGRDGANPRNAGQATDPDEQGRQIVETLRRREARGG
jgi:pyocin large subunit-like protein